MATEGYKRKLTTILSADVAGYSRLMGDDEAATLKTLTTYRGIMADLIKQHRGRMIDSPGDNVLGEFTSVVDAVQCAVAVQKELQARNAELPENRRMEFRIGINLGDVIEEEDRIYGDGVNIAARLEALADPGGICVSKTAFDHTESKLPLGYEYLGEQTVKNIAKPVGAYKVLMEPRVTVAEEIEKVKAVPVWRRKAIFAGTIAVLVAAIAVAIWNFYFRPPPMEPASVKKMAFPLPDKPSIAVLPFTNMSEDPKQEYFSDGMTEDLITELSKMSGLFVIARNSVFTYKGKPVKVQQVAEELGVRYVLEGSVRRAGDKVRISAQLIDTTKGGHLWAERYDGKMGDVFALQDNITQKIVDALAVKLTPTEQEQLASKDTHDITANQAFLQGWEHYLRLTAYDFAKAYSYYKKAIELDPVYWRAYAGLALLYWKGSQLGELHRGLDVSYLEARLRAREYLKMAMKGPTSLAHLVASEISLLRRQYEEAIADAKQAIALDPDDPSCHESFGWTLIMAGKPEEAVDFVKKAMRLDPHNPARYLYLLGLAHFAMGQLEEAVTSIEKARKLNPDHLGMEATLAAAYAHLGLEQRARTALDNYRKGWFGPLKLREVMYFYPFKDVEVADRFADGLLKAGLPGKPSGYYKLYEENKLTGEEIKELVFGRTTTGITPWARQSWWIERTNDGKATHQQVPFHQADREKGDSPSTLWREGLRTLVTRFESGKSWIEGDLLCSQWETVHEGLKYCGYCGTVFRNPEGTPEMKDEYLKINDFGIIPFSPVD
jgi:TolB-like protein/class 3 adenylate cyclase